MHLLLLLLLLFSLPPTQSYLPPSNPLSSFSAAVPTSVPTSVDPATPLSHASLHNPSLLTLNESTVISRLSHLNATLGHDPVSLLRLAPNLASLRPGTLSRRISDLNDTWCLLLGDYIPRETLMKCPKLLYYRPETIRLKILAFLLYYAGKPAKPTDIDAGEETFFRPCSFSFLEAKDFGLPNRRGWC